MSDCKFMPLSFGIESGEAGFREWSAQASNASLQNPTSTDEYSRGLADGQQLAQVAFTEERKQLLALAASAQALEPVEPHAIRCLILETVERLVSDIIGNAPVDRSLLLNQIDHVISIAGDIEDRKILWLNPDDIKLIEHEPIAAELRPDAQLVRGSIRLETDSGWLEHGRLMMLEALRTSFAVHGESA